MSNPQDTLTADQADYVARHLWSGLRAARGEVGIPWFDQPLNPSGKRGMPGSTVAVMCGRCCGKGAIESFSVHYSGKCFACGGSGVRYVSRAKYNREHGICPKCSGTGIGGSWQGGKRDGGQSASWVEHECKKCDGSGRVTGVATPSESEAA